MDRYYLYAHINPSNNKVYIGITKNLEVRWCGKGSHYKTSKYIYAAFKKYGWEHFIHVVLYNNLSKVEACKQEQLWIKAFKSINKSYNLSDGGEGVTGHSRTQQWKDNISKANKGRVYSTEVREQMSKRRTGKPFIEKRKKVYMFSAVTKQFIREFDCAETASVSLSISKATISAAANGNCRSAGGYLWSYNPYLSDKQIADTLAGYDYRKVLCYTLDGTLVMTYNNVKEAAAAIKGTANCISDCCSGRLKKYKNYIWRREGRII